MAGVWGSITNVAKSKYGQLRIASFADADHDHPENEEESAVSRSMRTFYMERDGYLPDWLAPAVTPGMQSARPTAHSSKTNASLSDIWDAPAGGQQQQQQTALPRQGQNYQRQQNDSSPLQQQQVSPPLAQQTPPQTQGLPSRPKGGVKPFMATKRLQQQQQQQQQDSPPPQQYQQQQQQQQQQPQPPPLVHSYSYESDRPNQNSASGSTAQQRIKERMFNRQDKGSHNPPPPSSSSHTRNQSLQSPPYPNSSSQQQQQPSSYQPSSRDAYAQQQQQQPSYRQQQQQQQQPPYPTSNRGQGTSRFAANDQSSSASRDSGRKPYMSATTPWETDDNEGYGGAPAYYGR